MSAEILVRDKRTPVLIRLSAKQLVESAIEHKITPDELIASANLMLVNSPSTLKEKWEFLKEVRGAATELNKNQTKPQEGK